MDLILEFVSVHDWNSLLLLIPYATKDINLKLIRCMSLWGLHLYAELLYEINIKENKYFLILTIMCLKKIGKYKEAYIIANHYVDKAAFNNLNLNLYKEILETSPEKYKTFENNILKNVNDNQVIQFIFFLQNISFLKPTDYQETYQKIKNKLGNLNCTETHVIHLIQQINEFMELKLYEDANELCKLIFNKYKYLLSGNIINILLLTSVLKGDLFQLIELKYFLSQLILETADVYGRSIYECLLLTTKGSICLCNKQYEKSRLYFRSATKLCPVYPTALLLFSYTFSCKYYIDHALRSIIEGMGLINSKIETYQIIPQNRNIDILYHKLEITLKTDNLYKRLNDIKKT